jgi:hypothetical protein
MAGVAGSTLGIAGVQPQIGDYVQDDADPTAVTNYAGVNTNTAWETNVLQEDNVAGFTAPVNSGATETDASWVSAAGTIAENGRCNIAAGVATADVAGTHECLVEGGVTANQYFWAVIFS